MRNWIIVAAIFLLVGLIGAGVTFGQSGFSFNTIEINKQERVSAESVERIHVEANSMNVSIIRGKGNDVIASLQGKVSEKIADDLKLDVVSRGDKITIKVEREMTFTIGINIFDADLIVELPERLYRELLLDTGSGDIEVRDWNGDTLKAELASGDVTLTQVKAKEVEVNVGSGEIRAKKLESTSAAFKALSGDIHVSQAAAEKISAHTASGEITLQDVDGELIGDTGSGDIRVSQEALEHDMQLSTGSGEVTIETSREPQSAVVRYSTSSGEFSTSWEGKSSQMNESGGEITFGQADHVVSVKTGAGDFSLKRR